MDYWEYYSWLCILIVWIIVLRFSIDKFSKRITLLWLVTYNILPIVLDTYTPMRNNPVYGLTFNGFFAAIFCYILGGHKKYALCGAFALICVTHFTLVTARMSGGAGILNVLFFWLLYPLEALVVILSMGLRSDSIGNRIYSSRMGHRFHNRSQRVI